MKFVCGAILSLFFPLCASLALAQDAFKPAASAAAPNAAGGANAQVATPGADDAAGTWTGIAPGTAITIHNWQQYEQFMPDGMVALFEGKYFWKMPQDVELEVGPTVIHPLPRGYVAATEKHGGQTTLITLPDGGLTVGNYFGGEPFPNPADPQKGWKIFANFWFRYYPHLAVNTPDNPGSSCTEDSNGSINCTKAIFVYHQLSYNTDPGVPTTVPGGEGKFFSFWNMIEVPEQLKYTATLTISYTDLTKEQEMFIFKPAVRRAERLSARARCGTNGADNTPDDGRFGFNANIPDFDATFVRNQKILSMMDFGNAGANFPDNYDMPLGWPKPSWGKWEVRDVHVIDVRKLPSKASGYCYGKRIMYIDRQWYGALWEDLYDSKLQLWKILMIQPMVLQVPQAGLQNSTNAGVSHYWDIQNNHMTVNGPGSSHGYIVLLNEEAPKQYQDIERYSTPSGLSAIMR
jgi:hypothetical protein